MSTNILLCCFCYHTHLLYRNLSTIKRPSELHKEVVSNGTDHYTIMVLQEVILWYCSTIGTVLSLYRSISRNVCYSTASLAWDTYLLFVRHVSMLLKRLWVEIGLSKFGTSLRCKQSTVNTLTLSTYFISHIHSFPTWHRQKRSWF